MEKRIYNEQTGISYTLHGLVFFGATCLWIKVAVIKFFNKLTHKNSLL